MNENYSKEDLLARLKAAEHIVLKCSSEENQYLPSNYEVAHDMGRWWEAALRLQASIGTQIPERMDKAMGLNMRALTNNPYGLLMNSPDLFGESMLNYHNLREALLAYTCLVELRNSVWAKNSAERLLDTIDRRFFEKTLRDEEICAATGVTLSRDTMINRPEKDKYAEEDYTPTTGRAIEGMYRYWKITQSPRALEVMQKAVAFHREHAIHSDGRTPEWMKDSFHTGHNHSYLGTVRGLLLYAIEFEDRELIRAIYLTYCNSILRYNCDETGFAPHDLAKARFDDENGDPLGDHASCADTIYIAYLLATECGYAALLDDVEKLMRGRLFYSQHMAPETLGAWGIFGGYYFAKGQTVDVFTAIASTLCRIYDSMMEEKEDRICIHLHFSKETDGVKVEADRADRQCTKIKPRVRKKIWVHIPAWCAEESVSVRDSEGKNVPFGMEGEYLVLPEEGVVPGETVEVSFALPERETTARTWRSCKVFRCRWKGDSLVCVEEIRTEE